MYRVLRNTEFSSTHSESSKSTFYHTDFGRQAASECRCAPHKGGSFSRLSNDRRGHDDSRSRHQRQDEQRSSHALADTLHKDKHLSSTVSGSHQGSHHTRQDERSIPSRFKNGTPQRALSCSRPPEPEFSERFTARANSEPEGNEESPLLCGLKPVLEMLKSEPSRVDLVYIKRGAHGEAAEIPALCRASGVRFIFVEPRSLDRILPPRTSSSGPESIIRHQGVIAKLTAASYTDFSKLLETAPAAPLPLILMADQIQDPGNLGTLVRTLYALGGAGLVVPRHNSAYLGAGAHRAAAGTLEKLPISRVTNLSHALDEAAEAGFHIYGAAAAEGSVSLYETPLLFPAVLVLGNEERGIRQQVAKRCEALLRIPMLRPFDSLNVAQAGAICIAEYAKQNLAKSS